MKNLAAFLFAIYSLFASAQTKWRRYVPISVDFGLNFPTVVKDSSSAWNEAPGKSFHIRSGYAFMYNKRIGFQAEGGLLINNYTFQSSHDAYDISHLKLSLTGTPYVLFPFKKNPESNFQLGCGFGYVFNHPETLNKDKGGYTISSQSIGHGSFIVCPEIGVMRFQKGMAFGLLLTYSYASNSSPMIQTTVKDASGQLVSKSKGDYMGLKLRFSIKFNKPKVYPNIYKKTPPEDEIYAKRANSVIRTFTTHKDYVTIELYESSKVDHDSISVAVNGKYVLINHALTFDKVKMRVPLEKGLNTITVYALNEGDIPPNTATCKIKYGYKEEEFPIQTGHRKNASIEIFAK